MGYKLSRFVTPTRLLPLQFDACNCGACVIVFILGFVLSQIGETWYIRGMKGIDDKENTNQEKVYMVPSQYGLMKCLCPSDDYFDSLYSGDRPIDTDYEKCRWTQLYHLIREEYIVLLQRLYRLRHDHNYQLKSQIFPEWWGELPLRLVNIQDDPEFPYRKRLSKFHDDSTW